jgi:1,2-diacylglycerol 3-beta-galactosyltransferase
MITKAGPGTIAEATIRGVPTMLSSFLPGQEAGNVPFVTDNGFGEYSSRPKQIARTVRKWIQDPQQLEEMSEAARACATPEATHEIASDLLEMLK